MQNKHHCLNNRFFAWSAAHRQCLCLMLLGIVSAALSFFSRKWRAVTAKHWQSHPFRGVAGGGLVNDAEVTKGVMTMVGFICPCDSRSPEQNLCDAVELLKGKNMKLLFLWLKLKRKITVDNNRSFFPGTISLLCLNRTMSFWCLFLGCRNREAEQMIHVYRPLLPNTIRYHPSILLRPLTQAPPTYGH